MSADNFNPHYTGSNDREDFCKKMNAVCPLMHDMLKLIDSNLEYEGIIEKGSIIHEWVKITLKKAA